MTRGRNWPGKLRLSPYQAASKHVGLVEALAGRAIPELRACVPPAPQPRGPRKPSEGILEKHVLRAVLEALHVHPLVVFVDRRQAGMFQEGERMIRVGNRGTLDISGMLKGGRYLEVECKRPIGGVLSPEQSKRIGMINAAGGVAFVTTSADHCSNTIYERMSHHD